MIVAEVRFTLARALWEVYDGKAKRARALELARAALAGFETYGAGFPRERAEARAWLDARAG